MSSLIILLLFYVYFLHAVYTYIAYILLRALFVFPASSSHSTHIQLWRNKRAVHICMIWSFLFPF